MKKIVFILVAFSAILFLTESCKSKNANVNSDPSGGTFVPGPDLILVGNDIITEVIVKPDSMGDPWELEKVKNYKGKIMFTDLFENIYNKKVVVYDIISGDALKIDEVKELEKKFGSDVDKIVKFQFLEDWYFDKSSNKIIKKIKSTSFGYEESIGENLSVKYRPLFRLNINQ
jgi:hypothetical protein